MEIAKHNKIIYRAYRLLGTVLVSVLKYIVIPDPDLILFNSFGGKKYDDSPKAIYEMMLKDKRFKNYKLVWAFHNPVEHPVHRKIKTDCLKYYITALKARCWVSNSSMQRGLVFKGRKTFSFNTWHGTPLKDMSVHNGQVNSVMDQCDVILAQSKFEVKAFCECWKIKQNKYRIFGLPRNDELSCDTPDMIKKIRKKLQIPEGKTVILYAPTFRDYLIDNKDNCMLEVPFDYGYWEKTFGDNIYFIMRVHYEVAKHNKLPENSIWHDYSDYPCLNDLMLAADILISDYSSIMFDFSIRNRPIINYIYDYEEYSEKRGMLFDIRKWLPYAKTSQELADVIKNLDYNENISKVEKFRETFVEEYGNATRKSVDYIYEKIKHNY